MDKLIQKLKAAASGTGKEYLSDLFIYLYITKQKILKRNSPEELRSDKNQKDILNGIIDLMFATAQDILLNSGACNNGSIPLDEQEMKLINEGYQRA